MYGLTLMKHDVPLHLKIALSVPEAAALISCSDWTVREMIRKGVLARVPHTDKVLIARTELDRLVNSGVAA